MTLQHALAAGLSVGQVRHKTSSGEWSVVRPRVYAVGGVLPTWVQAVAAAGMSLQPRAWLSHATAGQLWGFPGVEGDQIDVLVDLDRRVRMVGIRGHRSSALFSVDLTRHLRIPVTSPERTLVDLSAIVAASSLGRILDDGIPRRLIHLGRLRTCVGRLAKAPGRRPSAVHNLLTERLPGYDPGDSDLETRVLRVLHDAGLPIPVQQHRITAAGRSFRIDLAYPAIKVAIELDGWDWHRTRSAFDSDRARANSLVLDGWTLLRFTSRSSDVEIIRTVTAVLAKSGRFGAA
ncbi:MAG: hypothetical protein M3313_10600 [Actinomycetota bacterium]|nr:hypothetical protein [Actinomycetota bacterium]